ncbi:hypothetical protein FSARC_12295 [Fusarium sarcochroum]|uniref:Cytochrome P450 monooxygenase n=1 Tax=Fusarium sarcochroum TaxID=1208366 RepID=A0A8H4T9V9_9HYPO|nr:hypothetical protein FSARC_12295 [Fusarium sarcochroum]
MAITNLSGTYGAFALCIGSVLVVFWIASGIYYAFLHPLSKVPGPKLYVFTQLPYMYHLLRGDWHMKLKSLHDCYGPAVRFTYNDVSFITDDAIKTIFGHKSNPANNFEKDMNFYRKKQHSTIINANNDDHRRMRRLLSHAFSEKALRSQEDIMDHYVSLFIRQLKDRSRQGSVVDIVRWFNFATFDLIGDLAFGQPFGCLESGGYHPWVSMIFEGVKALPFRQAMIRCGLKPLAWFLVPAHLKRSSEEHAKLSRETVMKRLDSQNTSREDFMSYILRHNDKNGMSTPEIVENSSTLIIAGSETTATLLSGTTFYLLTNPAKYDKLVKEIRSTFESEDDITLTRVNQLTYLPAVFNEGLRMYPPVPSHLPRLSPHQGEFVNGYWLPAKTSVSVPHWSAYRSSVNFQDPDLFVPERWLGEATYSIDQKNVLQPFSYGPRNCIGRNLAYAEMRMLLARLLWNFDLELMPGQENWEKQGVYVLWEKRDLNVKLTEVKRQ